MHSIILVTMTIKSTVIASLLLVQSFQSTLAFAPAPRAAKTHGNGGAGIHHVTRTPWSTQLWYRALDQNDDETTMLKTANRVPVGFDMKKALAEQKGPTTAMNTPLIKALLANQGLILSLATAATYALLFFTAGGFSGPLSNMQDFVHWTGGPPSDMDLLTSIAVGVFGGAIPMLAFSNFIENSDNPAFANINFSTIIMCLTLFGRRQAPPQDLIPPELRGQTDCHDKVSGCGDSEFGTRKYYWIL